MEFTSDRQAGDDKFAVRLVTQSRPTSMLNFGPSDPDTNRVPGATSLTLCRYIKLPCIQAQQLPSFFWSKHGKITKEREKWTDMERFLSDSSISRFSIIRQSTRRWRNIKNIGGGGTGSPPPPTHQIFWKIVWSLESIDGHIYEKITYHNRQ